MKWEVGTLWTKFKRDWEGKWLPAVLKYGSKSNGKKNSKASEDEGL